MRSRRRKARLVAVPGAGGFVQQGQAGGRGIEQAAHALRICGLEEGCDRFTGAALVVEVPVAVGVFKHTVRVETLEAVGATQFIFVGHRKVLLPAKRAWRDFGWTATQIQKSREWPQGNC